MTIINGMILKHFQEPAGSGKAWCTGEKIKTYSEAMQETMDSLMCQPCLTKAKDISGSIIFQRIYKILQGHEPKLSSYEPHPSVEGCEGCEWVVDYELDSTPWEQYLQHLRTNSEPISSNAGRDLGVDAASPGPSPQ